MSGNYDGYNAGEPPEEGLKSILAENVDGILINDIEYLNRMMEQEGIK